MKSFLEDTTDYQPQGEDVPASVLKVCQKFDWICYFIERHPDGKTVVTFDDARFDGEQYAMFEMSLEVVERMARILNQWRSPFSL